VFQGAFQNRRGVYEFPEGYVLTLTRNKKEKVIEIFDNPKLKFSPVLPKVFTEKGLYMFTTIPKKLHKQLFEVVSS
jgi:hypothetical protein